MDLSHMDPKDRKKYLSLKKQANMHYMQGKRSMAQKYDEQAEKLVPAYYAESDKMMEILKNGKPAPVPTTRDKWVDAILAQRGMGKTYFSQQWLLEQLGYTHQVWQQLRKKK